MNYKAVDQRVLHTYFINSRGMIFSLSIKTMFEVQRNYIEYINHVPKRADSFEYKIIVCIITQFIIHHSRNAGDTTASYPCTNLVQLFHIYQPYVLFDDSCNDGNAPSLHSYH